MIIDNIRITSDLPDFDEAEAHNYIEHVTSRVREGTITKIFVKDCGDNKVYVEYEAHNRPFERIRRITGYLTGALTSWNDAKRAEEHERVKHSTREV